MTIRGLRDRVVRLDQRLPHVLRHGSGDQQPVRVPGRGDEVDPEPLQVEDRVSQGLRLEVAPVAPPRGHLPQVKRTSEKRPDVRGGRQGGESLSPKHQVLPLAARQGGIPREPDPFAAARLLAQTAEDAPPEVDRLPLRVDRFRRARLRARFGDVSGPEGVPDHRLTAKRRRKVRRRQVYGHVSRPRSLPYRFQHAMPLYKSAPEYDRLKLLLHTGKSEMTFFWTANDSPGQFRNDGSTTL